MALNVTISLTERVAADLTAAMKSKDAARLSVLRMAKAALKNREIEKMAPLEDAEAQKVLQALIKQREDSAEQFRAAARNELVAKEEAEVKVLREYLPEGASRRRDRGRGGGGARRDRTRRPRKTWAR